jgi:hypothetical protein
MLSLFSRAAFVTAFGLSLAAAATAEDYKWPLCDALPQLIEAGKETTPFKSMSDATNRGESIGYRDAPIGLKMESEKRRCFVYVAGSPEGVVGGGKHNKIECVTYRSPYGEHLTMSEVDPERAYLGGILGTCEALKGWTYMQPTGTGRTNSDTWTHPETGIQVLAELEETRRGSKRSRARLSVTHEVTFIVRAPNPSYVDPDVARAQREAEAALSE